MLPDQVWHARLWGLKIPPRKTDENLDGVFEKTSFFTMILDFEKLTEWNWVSDHASILTEIVMKHGQKSEEDAQAFIKKMETQKRYSADVWS